MERLRIGKVLRCQAAGEYQNIGYATLERLIDAEEKVNQGGEVKRNPSRDDTLCLGVGGRK